MVFCEIKTSKECYNKYFFLFLQNQIISKKIMYRSYLLLLLVFLCTHFVTNAQTKEPELKAVSVDTMSQLITLTWEPEPGVEGVTIFKCTANCDVENYYNVVDVVSMSQLEWKDRNANSSSAPQNYYCIGWLDSEGQVISGKSAPKNNMVLKASSSVSGCLNVITLSWNPYYVNFPWYQGSNNRMDTLDYYILYRKTDIDTSFILLDSVMRHDPSIEIRYETTYLQNDTWYDFLIQAISRTDTVRPFSNIVVYQTGLEIDTPVTVEITCVSVIENKYIEIDVVTDDFPEPFQKLYLLRAHPGKEVWIKDLLSFEIIDSLEYNPTNEYRFTDENINTRVGLYYYMAVADNKCKLNDTSNVLTNIYLYGRRMEKYIDSIRFLHVSIPFNSEWYDLLRVVYDRKVLLTGGLTVTNNSHYIDVRSFMDDGAEIKYQVRSISDCYSNTLTIEHEPYVRFPSAFYPQSINTENRTFYPILQFPSEDDYLFIIYNRWGQEVYRATVPPVYGDYNNPQGRWDGTFQGRDCPPGIYAFKISYSFNEKSGKYSDTGSVMLIR
jgi:hypothetical protein